MKRDEAHRAALAIVLALASALPLAEPSRAAEAPPAARDAVIGGTPVGSTRVLDGDLAVPGEWASVVALVAPGDEPATERWFCGATVVAPRWLLTAAHCLFGGRGTFGPADVRVVPGTNDLGAEPVDERVVTNLFVHPAYDDRSPDGYDDVALIELAHPLDVPAVALFDGDVGALGAARGVIVGWGATAFVDPWQASYPDVLQHAVVPLVSREICNAPGSYDGYVGDGQLCAGYPEGGVDSCIGDSGGPLFVDTGERIEQVGVVSGGRDCAQPLFYGIYSSVAAYRSWIGQYVELAPPSGEGDPSDAADAVPSVPAGAEAEARGGAGATGVAWWLASGAVALARRRYRNSERILSKLVWRMSRPLTR